MKKRNQKTNKRREKKGMNEASKVTPEKTYKKKRNDGYSAYLLSEEELLGVGNSGTGIWGLLLKASAADSPLCTTWERYFSNSGSSFVIFVRMPFFSNAIY